MPNIRLKWRLKSLTFKIFLKSFFFNNMLQEILTVPLREERCEDSGFQSKQKYIKIHKNI